MQTQAEIGALFARLVMADGELCKTLLSAVKRLSKERPDCLLPDDASNLAEWIHFMQCLGMCLYTKK